MEKGVRIDNTYMGNTIQYDPTNPEAREYVWGKVKKNYYDKGIKIFWLDEAEPEYTVYDFENYRYHAGPNVQVGNIYPVMYAKTFFDGMREAGQEQVVNLVRCAWAGSQKYGALVWSGDIHSTFESFQNQFAAGLNMAIAGIPWWTTDIGGFFGANIYDKAYHEVFVRWFEYGTFCPVMRLHGDRMPHQPQHGTTGGAACVSGAPNEIWSYGEEVYEICKKYIRHVLGKREPVPVWSGHSCSTGDGKRRETKRSLPAQGRCMDQCLDKRSVGRRPERDSGDTTGSDAVVYQRRLHISHGIKRNLLRGRCF